MWLSFPAPVCPEHRHYCTTGHYWQPGTYVAGLGSHHHTKITKVTIGEREHRHQGLEAMINKERSKVIFLTYIVVGICIKEHWELSVTGRGVTQHEQRDEH